MDQDAAGYISTSLQRYSIKSRFVFISAWKHIDYSTTEETLAEKW